MVNITLEEGPLGGKKQTTASNKHFQRLANEQNAALQKRIQQLEDENKELNGALEELDSQHNLALQNVLELKTELQEKLTTVTNNYETLKREHADKFINSELEMAKIQKQLESLLKEQKGHEDEKQNWQTKAAQLEAEIKKSIVDMADLQALLDKKTQDNVELIEKVKAAGNLVDKGEEECTELQRRIEQLTKELEEKTKQTKEKTTSESSTSSTGKQSEDEFIVVREADANSANSASPPTTHSTAKTELKDKIVQLENRLSELTLENGSLALKLQDTEMEKELATKVLHENMQTLQARCDETDTALRAATEQLKEQEEKLEALKEKAAESIIAQQLIKELTEEKIKIETDITNMKDNLQNSSELEKRLLLAENEKESLQIELQTLRATQERINELENKVQNLIAENQQLRLSVGDDTANEEQKFSADIAHKLKSLNDENGSFRDEVLSITHRKFNDVIAEEKQEITDLDADDDEPLSIDKIRELLSAHIKTNLSSEMMEEACRAVQERVVRTITTMERNITRLSDEIIDLQDSKMVWEHEKKTLEADISQYIIQCDELMKNNEILLNELENYKRNKLETIHENNEESVMQLEAQLEESSKLNQSLEQEYDEMNKKNDELEKEKQTLTEELRATQQQCNDLSTAERDLKLQLETLELEKANLCFELNEQKSLNVKQVDEDAKLTSAEEKCANLENQLLHLSKDHADLVAAMQMQKTALQDAIRKREEAEKELLQQEMIMKRMDEEFKTLQAERQQNAEDVRNNNEQLKQELVAKDIVLESVKKELLEMKNQITDHNLRTKTIQELEQLVEEKENCLQKLRNSAMENEKEKSELLEELKQQQVNAEDLIILKQEKEKLLAEFEELKKKYEAHSVELKALQESNVTSTSTDATAITRIAQLEAELLATADMPRTIETLNYEKGEMIKALQQKHAENMQYYKEIQRLQPLVQQLQQQQQQHQLREESTNCPQCPKLDATLNDLRKDLEKQHDQIKFLKEKSDILTTNLLTEQTNQRLMQQEKTEVEEQNATIRKDLERLREHLLKIEDMHTQETVEMQRELEETKSKMIELQNDVAKSSNAYTSASIRANQHAETLQAQYALLLQQRDELVNKLSLAEDRESKNQAALCNLQCALEQFQNDKQNDIKAATHSIRKEMQQEQQKQVQLQAKIEALQQQLSEAKQGLSAASRLTDQLETCQRTIAVLREEVDTIKQQNNQLSAKLKISESSQSDKIEKSLIKSLLIGYVVSSNPNDKTQVLRMISSVLDFTQNESDKVGLNKQQSSWLGAILGGSGGGGQGGQGIHSKENLVQAFVQFLEQESQPQADDNNMPNLLNISQQNMLSSTSEASGTATGQPQRRISTTSNSSSSAIGSGGGNPAPIPIQPMMLNEFAPTRNSSSILKDILSDS